MIRTLICDDSALFRRQLTQILHEAGIRDVVEASNGMEAVQLFEEHTPDFVFMDIIMPQKDGMSALKDIKSNKHSARIIMTSSCPQTSHFQKAIQEGADAFVQKPICRNNIFPLIEKYSPAPF